MDFEFDTHAKSILTFAYWEECRIDNVCYSQSKNNKILVQSVANGIKNQFEGTTYIGEAKEMASAHVKY